MSTDLVTLGKVIEKARTELDMSAREVADAAGISPVYLRAIERASNPKTGRPSRPSAEALLPIARALGIEAKPLLELAGFEPELAQRLIAAEPARGGIDDNLRRLQEAAKALTRRSRFVATRASERLESFVADFAAIADGSLRCDTNEERHLTQLALSECESYLRAVSYQDESWWTSPVGTDYLKLHENVLQFRPDVEMTRIFIVDPASLPTLRDTLLRHKQLNIRTYVLDQNEVDEHYWRDFVLYDEKLLRTGVTTAARDERKIAEFTDDPARLAQAVADFRTLRRLGRDGLNDVGAVLERLDAIA